LLFEKSKNETGEEAAEEGAEEGEKAVKADE